MKCPICNVDLLMSSREGIEIDYCPECRGVWLDRGELDKIIERSSGPGARVREEEPVRPAKHYEDDDEEYGEKDYRDKKNPKKRRGSWLADIMDFGE